MIPKQTLIATSIAINTIEETLTELDPYNNLFPDPSDSRSISDCEFPELVEDPFALVRALRGDAFAERLEYEDDLEYTLHILSDCLSEELARRGLRESDLFLSSSEDDDEDTGPSSTTLIDG
jgi:hypothetical protein